MLVAMITLMLVATAIAVVPLILTVWKTTSTSHASVVAHATETAAQTQAAPRAA